MDSNPLITADEAAQAPNLRKMTGLVASCFLAGFGGAALCQTFRSSSTSAVQLPEIGVPDYQSFQTLRTEVSTLKHEVSALETVNSRLGVIAKSTSVMSWAPTAFDYASSSCSAHAPYWTGGSDCNTHNNNHLHFDRWYTNGGQNGYWQVVTQHPETFVKFSLTVSRGPAFKIKYADDGSVWKTAATVASHSQNSEVEWAPVGAHRYWRYELTGDWSGGPWYNNLQFFSQTVLSTQASLDWDTEVSAFDYHRSSCSAHAPSWTGGSDCNTHNNNHLHFDQWYTHDGQDGYWQVVTEYPETFVRFSLTVSRGPAFNITYSDDGSVWQTAASVASHSQNSEVEWAPVGAHRYWRYELTGDWSGGPWYNNLQFYKAQILLSMSNGWH